MNELIILKSLLSHVNFLKYGPIISKLKNIGDEYQKIIYCVNDYYNTYTNIDSIKIDELYLHFNLTFPALKSKDYIEEIFYQLRNIAISNDELITKALTVTVDKYFSSRILAELSAVIQGDKNNGIGIAKDIISEYETIINPTTIDDDKNDVNKLNYADICKINAPSGYKWFTKVLQENLQGTIPGSLMHVFARPETGKTAFVVSEAAYFAYQMRETKDTILILNNEEPIHRIKWRTYQSLLGKPISSLAENKENTENQYKLKGGDRIVFKGEANTLSFIEEQIKRHKPKIVFLDQGPKVNMPGREKFTGPEYLQELYYNYRQLAIKYNLFFLCFGQADNASENKKWLGLSNLDGSKVGIPGECDVIIGIGKLTSPGYETMRYFNICKNKLTGKLGKGQAVLDLNINRYV